MKYMIASDIHGSAYYCRKMLEAYKREKAQKLVLLGDILYHGPRNDLPLEYAPKTIIPLLNEQKDEILAVRGNCDAEVDQMVLEFPIMADYAVLELGHGRTIYLSHGHIYHKDHLPPMKKGDVFLQGHTHVLQAEHKDGFIFLNPGSISIPKEGNPPTYAILEVQSVSNVGANEEIRSFASEYVEEAADGKNYEAQCICRFTIKTFENESIKEYVF